MIEQLAQYHPALPDIAVVSLLLLAAYLGYFFASRLLLIVMRSLGKRSVSAWYTALINNRVGQKLAQLLPVAIILLGVEFLPSINEQLEYQLLNLTSAYLFMVAALTIVAMLSAGNDIES
jgi:hypothetical protein